MGGGGKQQNTHREATPPGLPLARVRALASDHGYKELSFKEESRVISFRKESTRINVYYTTRTVGTCLNHPKRGKSQLFRRDVSLPQLKKIFQNPRTHTGKGYFHRKTSSQLWKNSQGGKNDNSNGSPLDKNSNEFEWDSARRWRYVCIATGLEPREDMIREVAGFCTGWDSLYWEPGARPDVANVQYGCGSTAALCGMMLEEAKRLVQDDGLRIYHYGDFSDYKAGLKTRNEMREQIADQCCNKEEFLEQFEREVHHLRVKLRRFSDDLRIELIRWFIERDYCGFSIVTSDMLLLRTELTQAVDSAHKDYGETMYNKGWGMCPRHGAF